MTCYDKKQKKTSTTEIFKGSQEDKIPETSRAESLGAGVISKEDVQAGDCDVGTDLAKI